MPRKVTLTERYWTVCWAGIFPYPCRKTRTVTKWCYDFSWVREQRFFLACRVEGCEHGNLYRWWAFCFNVIGTAEFGPMTLCFDKKRKRVGSCSAGAVERVRARVKQAAARVADRL